MSLVLGMKNDHDETISVYNLSAICFNVTSLFSESMLGLHYHCLFEWWMNVLLYMYLF